MQQMEHNHTTDITQKFVINELRLIIEDNLTNSYKKELEAINNSKLTFMKTKQKSKLEKSIAWHDQTYRKLLKEQNLKLKNLINKDLATSYIHNNVIALCKESQEKLIASIDVLTPIDFTDKDNSKSVYLWQFGYDYMAKFINEFKKNNYELIDCSINYYNDMHMGVHENNTSLLEFMNNNDVESILQYCIVKHCEILNVTLKDNKGRTFTLYRDGYIFDNSLTGKLCAEIFNIIKSTSESE